MPLPQRSAGNTGHISDHNALHPFYNRLGLNGRQVWLGTAADHGASDTNDGFDSTRPVATMARALFLLGVSATFPTGGGKPVGKVWVLPGRYSITPGNEWRINQRVQVSSWQDAPGTGPGDPPVVPEAKVVVHPADGAVLDFLVGLGERVWNPTASDAWFHAGGLKGIMVWGREDDATFRASGGSVKYGVWCHQLGELAYIHQVQSRACQVANWNFTGAHAGGTVGDIGTWKPGVGVTGSGGGIGVRIGPHDNPAASGNSGSLHFTQISGDDNVHDDPIFIKILGATGVSVEKIKAEGWNTICQTSDNDTQEAGFLHLATLSWNAGTGVGANRAVFRYGLSGWRFSMVVNAMRLTAGNPNVLDWSTRDADAIVPYAAVKKDVGFSVHSKNTYVSMGTGNYSGTQVWMGSTSLGASGFILDSPAGNFNPWQLWEYTSGGILQWSNPDADGYGWRFESDTITGYEAAAVKHVAAGQSRLWSSYRMAIGGTATTPAAIWESGSASPEAAVTAPVGSFYSQTGVGGGFWVKEVGSGNTGWVKK